MSEPTLPSGLPELPETELDPVTLVEVAIDPVAAQASVPRLRAAIGSAADDTEELLARGDLVDVLRVLDDTDAALEQARQAVDRAELVGTAAQQHLARLRLALVFRQRAAFPDANLVVTELLGAAQAFGPVIEAATHQLAALTAFDQGHWEDAAGHAAHALQLRERLELPEAVQSRTALEAARSRADAEPGRDGPA